MFPGASTTWLTAHVAFVLENIPQLEGICKKGAEYLHSVGSEDNGWGFNRRIGPDIDSTAQALIVLHRYGFLFDDFLLINLIKTQLSCGGFPTYSSQICSGQSKSGWEIAHPDTSAVVTELLRRVGRYEERLERCLHWLNSQLSCGVLHSYWWDGPFYGFWIQARTRLLTKESIPAIEEIIKQTTGIPQLPFLLTAATDLAVSKKIIRSAANILLIDQNSDGSWMCHPCLRVTNKEWFRSTAIAPGKIYADRRRIFSTAHSVAALFRVRDTLY